MAVSGFLDSHFLLMYNIKIIPLWEIMPVLRGFYMKHTYSLPLRFLALVLALALMLPMAALSWRFIEKPALALKGR